MLSLAHIPLTQLKGVGSKVQEKLEKLHLYSIQDMLFHLPLRYEDRTRIYPIQDLKANTHVRVVGEVMKTTIAMGKRRSLLITISDGTGSITLRMFHFSAAQKNQFSEGQSISCFGEIRRGARGFEMVHPEYRVLKDNITPEVEDKLTPVYPTTEGLKQLSLRKLADQALTFLGKHQLDELLPPQLQSQQYSLAEAIQIIHHPTPDTSLDLLEEGKHPAQQRLVIEELTAHHLSVLQLRQKQQAFRAVSIAQSTDHLIPLLASLPFTPTNAQTRVNREIQQDLAHPFPMLRLVQGDVGSGKTLVAAMAALHVIRAGYQVALMAPTELLAEQHLKNFRHWLSPLNIQVGWLAGKVTAKQKRETLAQLENGDIHMLVGTHAIFQEGVSYANLALVIIDEQHRFGVHQRMALREKGQQEGQFPHQLIMTATPIPRTLAMTAYADLDTSIIDELPPGRTPVTTIALPDSRRAEIIQRVEKAVKEDKRQVYWVCTLIEESEVLQAQAAEDATTVLKSLLPDLNIDLVHGRMKGNEKQPIMDKFNNGELNVLVATTVIEVGVDVPNASLMIIENPERLGLAQLHQLRGRVGRGNVESHCVLMYQHPLSKTAQRRLSVLRESTDGFYIAQQDLEIRGPGELLGTKQTGIADMKIADIVRDAPLIPQAQNLAQHIIETYPAQVEPLIHRWLGKKKEYGHA